jgi:hypothetical protein
VYSNGKSYTISTKSDMYIYTHYSQYRDAGWAKNEKELGTAVNVACILGTRAIGSSALT